MPESESNLTEPATTPATPTDPPARRTWFRFLLRWTIRLTLLGMLLVVIAGLVGYWILQASLPPVDGTIRVAGLTGSITIERDDLGVPTITADTRADLVYGLGFCHAQDRGFQMDALRRYSAGELAELVGDRMKSNDRAQRPHEFRRRAEAALARLDPEDRKFLEAYTAGVHAGLANLGQLPFEYLLLRHSPKPWRVEDSLLCLATMYLTLQGDSFGREQALGEAKRRLPRDAYEYFAWPGDSWDAPIEGGPFKLPPIPGPESIQLFDPRRLTDHERIQKSVQRLRIRRKLTGSADAASALAQSSGFAGFTPGGPRSADPDNPPALRPALGSNSFALAGGRTKHGGAIIGNDMHLQLQLPNLWYRVSMVLRQADGPAAGGRVTGVTLPGGPAVVVGSNGRIAWSFTNSEGDWMDYVVVITDPENPSRYRTPEGLREFEVTEHVIKVAGGRDERIRVARTIWGPILGADSQGRPLACRWVAHDPEGLNLRLGAMSWTDTVDQALDRAAECGVPHQNFLVADRSGRIAWTILGRIPRRFGLAAPIPGPDGHLPENDARLPHRWDDGSKGWNGFLPAAEYPRVIQPADGVLWSANQRMVTDPALLGKVGVGGYDLGARAGQIRDSLRDLAKPDEKELLQVQIDDRFRHPTRRMVFDEWRKLLLDALTDEAVAGKPHRAQARAVLLDEKETRAAPDAKAFPLVDQFREAFLLTMLEPGLESLAAEMPLSYLLAEMPLRDGRTLPLIQARLGHFNAIGRATFEASCLDVLDGVLGVPPANPTIKEDEINKAIQDLQGEPAAVREPRAFRHNIEHPLAVIPVLGRWLRAPRDPVRGAGRNLPLVAGVSFGASERIVVSPGREEEGIFHMPGGQSGHPLSPWFLKGHDAWVKGEPTSFLPGPPRHTLRLEPAPASR
jgi:penicillin amidase